MRGRARQVLRALALTRCELSISLVGDAEMRALNRAYRGRDRPTDVLAFAFADDVDERAAGLASARTRQKDAGGARARRRRRPQAARLPPAVAARRLLGDVVISIDTAAAQARASRSRLAARVDALLIHGVLHLIGYDHEISAAEERRMARRAREVRRALATEPRPAEPAVKAGARAVRT